MPAALLDIKQRLEKKATFSAAVQELIIALQEQQADPTEYLPLVTRCHALLKARYSSPVVWRLGKSLFTAAAAVSSSNSGIQSYLAGYIADADGILAADIEQPEERQQTLGELLLGLPPPQERPSHLSDAGLVLDDAVPSRVTQHQTAAPTAASAWHTASNLLQQSSQQQQLVDQADEGHRLQPEVRQRHDGTEEQQLQQQQQQLETQQEPDDALMLELLAGQLPRAELEAMLQSLTEGTAAQQGSSKPPASKRAVSALPLLQLTDAAALQSVGGPETACPVCTEVLQLHDSVQQLPCKHVFHVPCLAPWLQQNNSCPVCRHELPTDDHHYEARKEREAEEAEERRGAANALSHNEFMWI